jgi:hypothetical protein
MDGERGIVSVTGADDQEPTSDLAEPEPLAADLQDLRDLLEMERIEAARQFVTELEQRWPDSERVRHYAHVLAPPVARRRPDVPARSLDLEWQWLQEHGHEYPGCWLAIYGDRLIAADPDLKVVVARTREALGDTGAFLFHQAGSPVSR